MATTASALLTTTPPPVEQVKLSLEEYLRTSYHPDCSFVEDHLEERNLGELEHSTIQGELIYWFRLHQKEWSVRVHPELRARVSETRVRIPDVCVLSADAPRERVLVTPPLLCIEVLSPEDRPARTLRVMQDYIDMGVQNVWLIDPIERAAFTYTSSGLQLVDGPRLTISNSPIYLDLPELFASLD